MINVKVIKQQDKYHEITILGHAMYADYGKDIVCSAVSSIVTTSINGMLSLNKESLKYEVNDTGLTISNISNDDATQKLTNNMVSLLKELEKKYKKNITVK